MIKKSQIEKVLNTIPDPELGISILELGLIYAITVHPKGRVNILMTLTSVGCPLFDQIAQPIKEKIMKIKGVTSVDIDLTFEPPWTPDIMSKVAKMQLGFS